MSIVVYDLRSRAFYDPAVSFTMERFRAVLREVREDREMSRDRLALLTGLSKSTIQNAEMGPDRTGVDTLAVIVQALPGLTLSEFFRRIEQPEPATSDTETPEGVANSDGKINSNNGIKASRQMRDTVTSTALMTDPSEAPVYAPPTASLSTEHGQVLPRLPEVGTRVLITELTGSIERLSSQFSTGFETAIERLAGHLLEALRPPRKKRPARRKGSRRRPRKVPGRAA